MAWPVRVTPRLCLEARERAADWEALADDGPAPRGCWGPRAVTKPSLLGAPPQTVHLVRPGGATTQGRDLWLLLLVRLRCQAQVRAKRRVAFREAARDLVFVFQR